MSEIKKPQMNEVPRQQFFYPYILRALHEEGGEATLAVVREKIANRFDIPDEIRNSRHPTGSNKITNTIQWARKDLVDEGFLAPFEPGKTGYWKLSEKGKMTVPLLSKNEDGTEKPLDILDGKGRRQYLDAAKPARVDEIIHEEEAPPGDEDGDAAESRQILDKIKREQHDLNLIRAMDAYKFQRLCALLLKATGHTDIQITSDSESDGYDGFGYISVGLAKIKIAFRFQSGKHSNDDEPISVNSIRTFRAVMEDIKAIQGVFFTTSDFSRDDAEKEAGKHGIQIVGGEKFLELLYKHRVCCAEHVSIDQDALNDV